MKNTITMRDIRKNRDLPDEVSRTSSSDTKNTNYQGEDVIKNNERKDGRQ